MRAYRLTQGRATDDGLRAAARIAPWFALAYLLLWLANLDLGPTIPRDGTSLVVGRDFLNFWMAGRAAWQPDPQRFYDLATYQAAVAEVTGPGYLGQVWSYPPSIMLLAAPFGRLHYLPALLLWTIAGPIVLVAALRQWTSDRRVMLAALLSPAAVFGLISGQFALIATALLLTGLRLRDERPWLAGLLIGLLSLKPQLGLFLPLLLLVTRNWRTFVAAAATTLAVAGLTAAIWGVEAWTAYLSEGIATQSRVLSDPEALPAPFMPTVFMNLRGAGASVAWAWAVQAVATASAAAFIAWRFWPRPSASDWRFNAAFLAAALFGTPYLLSYDTLPLTAAVLLAASAAPISRYAVLGVWLLPLLQLALGGIGVPGPALIPLAAALYLAKQAASSTWVDQRNCPTGLTHERE